MGRCHTRSPLLFVQHLNETPVISLLSEDPLENMNKRRRKKERKNMGHGRRGENKRAKKEFAANAGESIRIVNFLNTRQKAVP